MARLFNAYVVVAWSAASKAGAGADPIWIGVLKRDVRFRLAFESYAPPTRAEAEKRLGLVLDDLKKRGERALLALNFPLGFPRGLGAALKLNGAEPWSALWDQLDRMVKDKPDNTNNRFGVGAEINRRTTDGPFPFWGCPPRDALTTLQPKRTREHGPGDLPEFRYADLAVKGPSIWKLYYAGATGGHAILGIPMLRRLRKAREGLRVWPFETGWKVLAEADLDGVEALAVETQLGLQAATPLPNESKELAQVRAFAERAARLDEAGKLGAAFAPPKGVDEAEADVVAREEGWILNV